MAPFPQFPWMVGMHDARAFTDYRPSCEVNALLAKRLGAADPIEYRTALVSGKALGVVRDMWAEPKPGVDRVTR